MFNWFATLAETTVTNSNANSTSSTEDPWMQLLGSVIPLVIVGVLFYFVLIRPQKKRQKEEEKMRNEIRVGDEITTIGGIVGRVVTVKEDTLVIETGANCNKMVIKKWALQTNDTVHDTPADDDDDDDDDI